MNKKKAKCLLFLCKYIIFHSSKHLNSLSPCTKRTSVSEVRLTMHALFQRLQRYGAIANIALVNLTDPSSPMLMYHLYIPLVSSVHIVQSINFSSKIIGGVCIKRRIISSAKHQGSRVPIQSEALWMGEVLPCSANHKFGDDSLS